MQPHRSQAAWSIFRPTAYVMRDDFPEQVKRAVAQRVGHKCSNPECQAYTSGPQVDPSKALNLGVAAHITAASEGGPRYDRELTPDQRSHATNAIWLCQNCAKLVDNDPVRFSAAMLRRWKHEAELLAYLAIGKRVTLAGGGDQTLSGEEIDLLIAAADSGKIVIIAADQVGKWVGAGENDYLDSLDPAYARAYVDALQSLCAKRLAEHDMGNLYTLTTGGFKVARNLKQAGGAGRSE